MSLVCLARWDIWKKKKTLADSGLWQQSTGNIDFKKCFVYLVFLYEKDLLNCVRKFLPGHVEIYDEKSLRKK